MPKSLLYFQPDPKIEDADLLGYGDLVYSDGTTQFVNGDPELSMGLPKPPPGVNPEGSIGMGPPQAPEQFGPPPPPVTIDTPERGQVQVGNDGSLTPLGDQTGAMAPLGEIYGGMGAMPGQEPGPAPMGSPDTWGQQAGNGGQQPITFQADDGQPYTVDATGTLKRGGGGIPFEQAQSSMGGGMVPVQREGALPPDVAQRQLSQLGQQQSSELAATEQARAGEVRLMNELTLKQMAANEAERTRREQEMADQQSRVERWQQERQALMDQNIETDLVSAKGPVGAALAVIGATLLGGAGNDAGFRMIEKSIDQHVRMQVQRRDSKLGLLAQQIGSSTQAIALGKAALYKVSADRLELLAQKTKSDVYEAQSPAAVEKLRTMQLKEMQDAERLSLGKTLEKVPLPPKPPSEEMLVKYGTLRRDREGGANIAQRAEQELGLMWAPGQNGQPGHYANKAEVLKNGIQGVGNLEHWVPDMVYSTMGGMTSEGYQVRGSAEAMAYAQIRQMQPTGPISNADIQASVKAGALNTEEGLIRGLERIRTTNEGQQQHDSAQFGPDVVSEYNRRYQQSGGQGMTAQPTASRPATPEEMRAHAQALRQPKPAAGAPAAGGGVPDPSPEEFQNSAKGYAQGAGLNPEGVWSVIQHESGGKPGVTNKHTGKHAGLIQFSKETWAGLAKEAGKPELTWEKMREMSAEEQLPYVMMYFNRLGLGPNNDPGDYAMAAFMPAFWNKPDDFVLGEKDSRKSIAGLSMAKVYSQNPGLQNGTRITVGDVRRSVR